MRDQAPAEFGDTAALPVAANVPTVASAVPDQPVLADDFAMYAEKPAEYDPLRLCIYTTIGVIAWLITPPLTVAIFGWIGVAGYWRARRRGLAASRCFLGDTRLVIAYLALAATAGTTWMMWSLLG